MDALIRQTIEVYGKYTLGFYRITDGNGNRTNISPQVAWDFIKRETLSPTCRITLPVHIDIIQKVEEWTNFYIHTGNIPEFYLIDNALEFIMPLVYPLNNTRDYRGQIVIYGTTLIQRYDTVKADFTTFINSRRSRNILIAFWLKVLKTFKVRRSSYVRVVEWFGHPEATVINL